MVLLRSHLNNSESSLSSLVGVVLTPLFLARGHPDRLPEGAKLAAFQQSETAEGGSNGEASASRAVANDWEDFSAASTSDVKRSSL